MTTGRHSTAVGAELHPIGPVASYADAAARTGATGLVSTDIGKVYQQTDTGAYYLLTAVTPSLVWEKLTVEQDVIAAQTAADDAQAAADASVQPARILTAGTGLSGGGDLSADRTFACDFGTTSGKVCEGDDSRVLNAVQTSRTITAGTGLSGGGDLSANRTLSVSFGSTAGTVCAGDDARLNSVGVTEATVRTALALSAGAVTTNAQPVNGRNMATDGAKLDGIEAGAQAVTEAHVRTALAAATASITTNGQTINGRNLATDGTKLDGVAATADVTATALPAALSTNRLAAPVKADYATTTALPACTYANGTLGVGATLTGNSNAALSAQDGQSPTVNDVIMVKDQASALQNGPYIVTQVGDGSHPFILTRLSGVDVAARLAGCIVHIRLGNNNTNAEYALNLPAGSITVGTTALTFVQSFAGSVKVASKKQLEILSDGMGLSTQNRAITWGTDFDGASTTVDGFSPLTAGTGATVTQVQTNQDASHVGIHQLATGTTTTGRAAQGKFANALACYVFGSANEAYCEWWVRIPTLSDGTDTFGCSFGLMDGMVALLPSNGVHFTYDQATDTHWRMITANGSSRTSTNTTITVTAGQWYRLAIKKYAGANAWEFFIDGVSVSSGVVSATIPTAAVSPGGIIIKSAGTNARTVLVDGCNGYLAFDSARYA